MTDATCPTCGHDPGDLTTAYLCGAAGIGGKWTRTPPSEPGWYWGIHRLDDKREPIALERYDDAVCEPPGWTSEGEITDIVLWYSTPIPMPPLPEGD